MSDNNSYRHILKYTGVFGSVQGLNVLVSLVRNKFVALLLGPSGMGLVSLLNTAMSFISQASNLGIAVSAVRHMAELYDVVFFHVDFRCWANGDGYYTMIAVKKGRSFWGG